MSDYINQIKSRIAKHQAVPADIQIDAIEFTRPYRDSDRINDRWEFRATPSVEYPHGHKCFGGHIERTGVTPFGNQWIAYAGDVIGKPQATRKAAIESICQDVYRSGQKSALEELDRQIADKAKREEQSVQCQLDEIARTNFDNLFKSAEKLLRYSLADSPNGSPAYEARQQANILHAQIKAQIRMVKP